jgi:hypothetical protein
VVWTVISEAGLELLRRMEPVIRNLPGELLGHLDGTQLAEFICLLELARTSNQDSLTPLSSTGPAGSV